MGALVTQKQGKALIDYIIVRFFRAYWICCFNPNRSPCHYLQPLASTIWKTTFCRKKRIYSWSAHCNDRHYHQIASSFSRRLHSSVAFEGWWGTFRLWALLCWRSCIDICRYQKYQSCQRRECTLWRSRFCNWLQDCRRFVLEFLFWLSRQVRTDWHFLLLAKNLYGSACCCKADVCDLVDEFFYFTAVVGLFLMSLF